VGNDPATDVALLQVELFRHIAPTGIQDKEGTPYSTSRFFNGCHERLPDPLLTRLGIDHDFLHFGAMLGIGLRRKRQLYSANHLGMVACDQEDACALGKVRGSALPIGTCHIDRQWWQEPD